MRRRLVWIQGGASADYPLKILLEGNDGYYVGGWTPTPVFVAPFSNATYSEISLLGITATGPGPNDWLVGGYAVASNVGRLVFYNHTGLILDYPVPAFTFTYVASGHFATVANFAADIFHWATPDGNAGTESSADFVHGFVLPNVFAGRRLSDFNNTMRQNLVPSLDLSYALFVGWNGILPDYPSGNPWLASASGTFTRLDTDLNSAIRRCDLIGLTLYEKADNFIYEQPWPSAGEHSLTITPHTITTGGTVATGTTFPIKYLVPAPNAYFSVDASLWVSPPTP